MLAFVTQVSPSWGLLSACGEGSGSWSCASSPRDLLLDHR